MSILIYLAADPVEAEIVRAYLAGFDIATRVEGSALWGAVGELPGGQWPRLMLERAQDEGRARQLLHQYRNNAGKVHWPCDGCGESVPGEFELCWNCGHERRAEG